VGTNGAKALPKKMEDSSGISAVKLSMEEMGLTIFSFQKLDRIIPQFH
jgi:hypothetical protein